jgi:hypothetical protein
MIIALVVILEVPTMVQPDESSTLRIKVGKVRKLPPLSAIKLYPLRQQKHQAESNGLQSFGTFKTSCKIILLLLRQNDAVPRPRHSTLLLSARITYE